MKIGDVFNTDYEEGCIVTGLPNSHGEFKATDSEGVECYFHIAMVKEVKGGSEGEDSA